PILPPNTYPDSLHSPGLFRPALDLISSDIESSSKPPLSTTRPYPGASTAAFLSRQPPPRARAYSAANPPPTLDQNSTGFTL
ncbi:hypothetical protein CABS01_14870, partial [Colletotrichum abscissum]|uniref:uncharacterized protein n=1 Tax=Colletotrichum abscissum TaxID=1671311 RepID=UPI0027D6C7B8